MNIEKFKPAIVYAIYIASTPEKVWQALCPGAKLPGIPHQLLEGGHFIQEDQPEKICDIMIQFIADFPVDVWGGAATGPSSKM